MENKLLYILAGYDDKTSARLESIQNKLYECGFIGTHTKNIPLHITLGSFPTSKAKESELADLIRSIADRTSPFEITFNSISIFDNRRVLFVAPDTSKKLLDLKETFGDSYNWTAHTTMIIDEPDVILKALPIVLDSFSAFSGKITSLHLYEFFPTRHILSVDFR